MTHLFFTDPKTIQRLYDGPLKAHIDAYAALLQSQGYTGQSARSQIRLVADLSRWLRGQGLATKDLNPQRTHRYLSYRKRLLRPRRGDASALVKLLGLLREAGVVNDQTPAAAVSPGQRVEENFKRYLSQERGLSSATLVNYLSFVRQFLVERFGAGRIHLADLRAADITGFVQRHAHDLSPGRTKLMVTALRSFLRHLRHQGDIATDLAACVPCVPNWSFSTLPKFLPPGQVERILKHCDQQTPSGKRDYAILLLLARLGLRAGEVVGLTLNDINWEEGHITLRSKGGRWAQLPLPAEVGEALACSSSTVGRAAPAGMSLFVSGRREWALPTPSPSAPSWSVLWFEPRLIRPGRGLIYSVIPWPPRCSVKGPLCRRLASCYAINIRTPPPSMPRSTFRHCARWRFLGQEVGDEETEKSRPQLFGDASRPGVQAPRRRSGAV